MKFNEQYTVEDTNQVKNQATEQGVRRWQKAGYGLSVHWGLYALSTEGNEWIYFTHQIPFNEYKQRMERFNPTRFNAEEWADLMVESGQKFLIITSKHHDGFCLWDSPLTEFKVTNTPFARDILEELADALHSRDLGLHFYYSLVDWTHPAYRNDWPAYVEYYQAQIRDLCTNFGEIGGVLFDGYWPRQEFDPGMENQIIDQAVPTLLRRRAKYYAELEEKEKEFTPSILKAKTIDWRHFDSDASQTLEPAEIEVFITTLVSHPEKMVFEHELFHQPEKDNDHPGFRDRILNIYRIFHLEKFEDIKEQVLKKSKIVIQQSETSSSP